MEKTILASALLLCIGLAWSLIRRLFRDEGTKLHESEGVSHESDDPTSLQFDGVGPGPQGFGLYSFGTRIDGDVLGRDD